MSTEPAEPEIRAPITPDARDERDVLYEPGDEAPSPRPDRVDYKEYRRFVGTTWHQRGQECTGFALAAIANYRIRRHLDDDSAPSVSRRMLYELAQLHDNEGYEQGSTLRGALKGWQRVGVARDDLWPYHPDDEFGTVHGTVTLRRVLDARHRPLQTYRRIMHQDLDRMRDALAAGHALFAGAEIHVGWYRLFMPEVEPVIEYRPDDASKGGHAFVIVGYDEKGFWVHNSWGPEWGTEGYALLPYDDWQKRGRDTWVVDIAPDHTVSDSMSTGSAPEQDRERVVGYRDLWPHLVVLRDDGKVASDGLYEMDDGSVKTLIYLFQERTAEWSRRRLAVIADAGYLPTAETIERYRHVRDQLMANEIYPVFLVWETAWFEEFADELDAWIERDGAEDGPVERSEPAAAAAVRRSAARPIWAEVIRRAGRALEAGGGAEILGDVIAKKREQHWFDLHLISHGAGDALASGLLDHLPTPVTTATTVAPTTSVPEALRTYGAALEGGRLQQLSVLTADADAEAADRVGPLSGSLVRVVGDLFADEAGAPLGSTQADDSAWADQREAGRFVRAIRGEGDHVDLGWQAMADAETIAALLAHTSEPGQETPAPTRTGTSLPSDPLAWAEAMRDAAR